jgi:hypothetical protein
MKNQEQPSIALLFNDSSVPLGTWSGHALFNETPPRTPTEKKDFLIKILDEALLILDENDFMGLFIEQQAKLE